VIAVEALNVARLIAPPRSTTSFNSRNANATAPIMALGAEEKIALFT